jgi:hypothetical protein
VPESNSLKLMMKSASWAVPNNAAAWFNSNGVRWFDTNGLSAENVKTVVWTC